LTDIVREKRENIHLQQADLNDPDSWDKVMIGMDYVIHAACPNTYKEKDKEIIELAINGVRNVMKSALK